MTPNPAGGSAVEGFESRYERLYVILRNEKNGLVPIGRFLKLLFQTGIRRNDPRLRNFFEAVNRYTQAAMVDPADDFFVYEALQLSKEEFHDCIKADEQLVFRALTGDLVIPEFDKFSKKIEDIYESCRNPAKKGKVADYIPQLARFSPDIWSVTICTVDGQRFSIGESEMPFCLQSTSKALNYAIAQNDMSADQVHTHVGREPSGRSFNALTLDNHNLPHNPMINSGAISTAALLKTDLCMADRFDFVTSQYRRMAGGEFIGFSNSTFLSERETADRNFALGYYMKENGVFPENAKLNDTLDLYFQLCSVEVTADSAAVIAATLANGGMCPLTGDEVLSPIAVRNTLSLMYSCGMYDYSGQFAFKVGLPAKSGVSGIVMCVIPNVMGICTWSPPLDESGNSVRGVQFCEELVRIFNFHNYDALTHSKTKFDPRRTEIANKAHEVVSLLTNAANGGTDALKRFRNKFDNEAMDQADYDGRTALHLAAAEGHLETVKYLVNECKVNPLPKDRYGGTPIDDAEKAENPEIIEFLKPFAAAKV